MHIAIIMAAAIIATILLIFYHTQKTNSSKFNIGEEKPTQFLKDIELFRREPCLEVGITCPPWSYCDNTDRKCKCIKLPGAPLLCDEGVLTKDNNPPLILDCYCITAADENDLIEVGQCDVNCANHPHDLVDLVYKILPPNISDWNNFMCGEFSRYGTLCGKCDEENNYYPRAYSFDLSCIKCDDIKSNLLKYIILVYVPLTIFYFLIFFLKVDIHSSQLQGFIIFSQYISIPALARNIILSSRNKPAILAMVKFVGGLYGVWNLDFFRTYNNNICFRISPLATLSLDLAVAVYPLLLMLITYILINLYDQNFKPLVVLWKPLKKLFGKCHRNIKTSIVDSYAAFIFLTNSKFFSTCFDILTPVKVFQFHSPQHINISWRVYYDPNVEYFSSEHCLYAVIALISLFMFVIFPVLILILHSISFFQKFLTHLPRRWQIYLHTFVDSFQGCYKDGTEPGTKDCRWYAPIVYVIRFLLMTVYAFSLDSIFFPYGAIVLTILALLTIIVEPFKSHLKHLSSSMTVFILFIAGFHVSAIGEVIADESRGAQTSYIFYTFTVVLSLLPLLYIMFLVLLRIISHFGHWNLSGNLRRRS